MISSWKLMNEPIARIFNLKLKVFKISGVPDFWELSWTALHRDIPNNLDSDNQPNYHKE